ncbi:hypothetical protein FBU30_006916 [Linnemannia zychae]|nr:hypothetical protein FBU30_006916 [Linnemannia zychae]
MITLAPSALDQKQDENSYSLPTPAPSPQRLHTKSYSTAKDLNLNGFFSSSSSSLSSGKLEDGMDSPLTASSLVTSPLQPSASRLPSFESKPVQTLPSDQLPLAPLTFFSSPISPTNSVSPTSPLKVAFSSPQNHRNDPKNESTTFASFHNQFSPDSKKTYITQRQRQLEVQHENKEQIHYENDSYGLSSAPLSRSCSQLTTPTIPSHPMQLSNYVPPQVSESAQYTLPTQPRRMRVSTGSSNYSSGTHIHNPSIAFAPVRQHYTHSTLIDGGGTNNSGHRVLKRVYTSPSYQPRFQSTDSKKDIPALIPIHVRYVHKDLWVQVDVPRDIPVHKARDLILSKCRLTSIPPQTSTVSFASMETTDSSTESILQSRDPFHSRAEDMLLDDRNFHSDHSILSSPWQISHQGRVERDDDSLIDQESIDDDEAEMRAEELMGSSILPQLPRTLTSQVGVIIAADKAVTAASISIGKFLIMEESLQIIVLMRTAQPSLRRASLNARRGKPVLGHWLDDSRLMSSYSLQPHCLLELQLRNNYIQLPPPGSSLNYYDHYAEGLLYKRSKKIKLGQGNKEYTGVWKERWVVLQGNRLFIYHKRKDTTKKSLELVPPLTVVTSALPQTTRHSFKLTSSSVSMSSSIISIYSSQAVPIVCFRASSESELNHWIRIFNSLNNTPMQGLSPPLDPHVIATSVSIPPPLPPLPIGPPPISMDKMNISTIKRLRHNSHTDTSHRSIIEGAYFSERKRSHTVQLSSTTPSINPALISNAAAVLSNLNPGNNRVGDTVSVRGECGNVPELQANYTIAELKYRHNRASCSSIRSDYKDVHQLERQALPRNSTISSYRNSIQSKSGEFLRQRTLTEPGYLSRMHSMSSQRSSQQMLRDQLQMSYEASSGPSTILDATENALRDLGDVSQLEPSVQALLKNSVWPSKSPFYERPQPFMPLPTPSLPELLPIPKKSSVPQEVGAITPFAKNVLARTVSLFVENRSRSAPPESIFPTAASLARHSSYSGLLKNVIMAGSSNVTKEQKNSMHNTPSQVGTSTEIKTTPEPKSPTAAITPSSMSNVIVLAEDLQKVLQTRQEQTNNSNDKSPQDFLGCPLLLSTIQQSKTTLSELTFMKRKSIQQQQESLNTALNVERSRLKLIGVLKTLKEGGEIEDPADMLSNEANQDIPTKKDLSQSTVSADILRVLLQCPFMEQSEVVDAEGNTFLSLKGYTETEAAWKSLQGALENFLAGPIKDQRSALPPEDTLIPSYHAPRAPELRLSEKAQNFLRARDRAYAVATAAALAEGRDTDVELSSHVSSILNSSQLYGITSDVVVDTTVLPLKPTTIVEDDLSTVSASSVSFEHPFDLKATVPLMTRSNSHSKIAASPLACTELQHRPTFHANETGYESGKPLCELMCKNSDANGYFSELDVEAITKPI